MLGHHRHTGEHHKSIAVINVLLRRRSLVDLLKCGQLCLHALHCTTSFCVTDTWKHKENN